MFIELTKVEQFSGDRTGVSVNTANITYVEDLSGDETAMNAQVHFPHAQINVSETREQINAKVDNMREEMMEGMVPDISDMGGMF